MTSQSAVLSVPFSAFSRAPTGVYSCIRTCTVEVGLSPSSTRRLQCREFAIVARVRLRGEHQRRTARVRQSGMQEAHLRQGLRKPQPQHGEPQNSCCCRRTCLPVSRACQQESPVSMSPHVTVETFTGGHGLFDNRWDVGLP